MAGRCARCVLSACISRSFLRSSMLLALVIVTVPVIPLRVAMRFAFSRTDAITGSIRWGKMGCRYACLSRYLRTREKDKKERQEKKKMNIYIGERRRGKLINAEGKN